MARGCARKGARARGEPREKDAGAAGKGAAPATNFRARGHCGAGAWPRRRSKRKIDAIRGDEKQHARAHTRARALRRRRLGGKKKEGKKKKSRTAKRARKREENARGGRAKRTILRRGVADRATLSRENHPLSFFPSFLFPLPLPPPSLPPPLSKLRARQHPLYLPCALSPLAANVLFRPALTSCLSPSSVPLLSP